MELDRSTKSRWGHYFPFVGILVGLLALTGCGKNDGEEGDGIGNKPQDTFYIVTAEAGAGGGISPASQQVKSGTAATLQISLNTGYKIAAVTGCNGTLNGNTYSTGLVTANCAVNASFEKLSYLITAKNRVGGEVKPASQQVEYGDVASFQLSVANGYRLESISGCGGVLKGTIYETAAVTAPCEILPVFVPLVLTGPVNGAAEGASAALGGEAYFTSDSAGFIPALGHEASPDKAIPTGIQLPFGLFDFTAAGIPEGGK